MYLLNCKFDIHTESYIDIYTYNTHCSHMTRIWYMWCMPAITVAWGWVHFLQPLAKNYADFVGKRGMQSLVESHKLTYSPWKNGFSGTAPEHLKIWCLRKPGKKRGMFFLCVFSPKKLQVCWVFCFRPPRRTGPTAQWLWWIGWSSQNAKWKWRQRKWRLWEKIWRQRKSLTS